MGVYLYMLSGQTKKIKAPAGRAEINLMKFVCKPGYRDLPPLVKARMAKNENYWANREKPKLVAFGLEDKNTVIHWDPEHPTVFEDDSLFLPAAGVMEQTDAGLSFKPYMSLRGESRECHRAIYARLEALREQIPGVSIQSKSGLNGDGSVTEFYIHARTPGERIVAKLAFPEAEPFNGF